MFESKYLANLALFGEAIKACTDNFKGSFKWIIDIIIIMDDLQYRLKV